MGKLSVDQKRSLVISAKEEINQKKRMLIGKIEFLLGQCIVNPVQDEPAFLSKHGHLARRFDAIVVGPSDADSSISDADELTVMKYLRKGDFSSAEKYFRLVEQFDNFMVWFHRGCYLMLDTFCMFAQARMSDTHREQLRSLCESYLLTHDDSYKDVILLV